MNEKDKLYFISSVRLSKEPGFGYEPDRYVANTLDEILQKEKEYLGDGIFATSGKSGVLMMYSYKKRRWEIIGSISSASTPRMITSENAYIWNLLPNYTAITQEYLNQMVKNYEDKRII